MPWSRQSVLIVLGLSLCSGQGTPPDVGSGAPSQTIRTRFVQAYFRNNFAYSVATPPATEVRKFGTTGLIQEFQDAAKTQNVRLALVKANTSDAIAENAIDVFQVLAAMYAYYNSIGVTTAGYPTNDTARCATVSDLPACTWQLFDKNHALFVYERSTGAGDSFAVRDPFYTRWAASGGINGLGPATNAEQAVTSSTSATAATMQPFQQGAIYNLTSGVLNGRLLSVRQPIWSVYLQNGMQTAFLGLPSAEEVTLVGGRRRQTFEGGSIEYDAGGIPTIRLPVTSVAVSLHTPAIRLNLGESFSLEAHAFAATGAELLDRPIVWTTSNSRVVQVQASGSTAVLRAVGGGSATVTANAEGRSSPPVSVFVSAPCCQIGEGSPTPSVQQAFQDAVTRNRLNVKLPAAATVRRSGNGLVQELAGSDGNARYLVAMSDRSPVAYVIGGSLLEKYEALGGPSGALSYPLSDATPGGRQLFENSAALAGTPPRVVSGTILARWAALGYETGVAGSPAADPIAFFTFAGTRGTAQAFANGVFYAASTRVVFVSGLVLSSYLAMNGPAGQLGMPTGDEFGAAGRRRQDFEGGHIDYTLGDAEAIVTETERRPSVSASPSILVAGSRVRLTLGGFDTGATLRVSMSGAPVGSPPAFIVKTENGAHSWDAYIPAAAQPGVVLIRANDANGSAVAQGSYVVRTAAESRLTLSKLNGDAQTGAPGVLLSQPLRIALRDESGNPLPGVSVRFEASPGSNIVRASNATDERGEAEAWVRLGSAEGVAAVTAAAAARFVTFNARIAATTLPSFPRLNQTADGPLVASLASILRFYQTRGLLAAPNGQADPASLAAFLKSFCIFDYQGQQVCDGFVSPIDSREQIANPWRVAAFAGGNADVVGEQPDFAVIRDLVGQGNPVLVALSVTADGTAQSTHFVVAIGVAANGTLVIHDPNPALARSNLYDYLEGFTTAGRLYQAVITGALRLRPGTIPSGFVVHALNAAIELESSAGVCGANFSFADAGARAVVFRQCSGTQQTYQLDITAPGTYRVAVTDLGSPTRQSQFSSEIEGALKVTRPASQWIAEPQDAVISTAGIVNAATLTTDIAPGTLVYIRGSGLARVGATTAVEIGGIPAPMVAATRFQITAQVPFAVGPGLSGIVVRSPLGTAEAPLEIKESAPGIIRLDNQRAAIVNENGSINFSTSPARRGQRIAIYGTGFGVVDGQGQVLGPVTAIVGNTGIETDWTGLTAGFVGLYQTNLTIPVTLAPGLDLPIALKLGGTLSPAVEISVE